MGDYLRRIKLDYAGAIEQYSQGERQSPSNAELFRGIGQAEQTPRSVGRVRWSICSRPSGSTRGLPRPLRR